MNLAAGISTTAPGSEGLASRGWAAPCLFISQEETFISAIGMSVKCRQEGTFGQALLYISELMATPNAPAGALPPELASPQRSAAGRPQRRSHCPGGRARLLSRAMFSWPVRG